MPSTETLEALLVRAKALLGERGLIEALSSLMNPGVSPSEELTIVSNAGMHNIPSAYVHGELYVASDGNLELSSQENISETYASVLQRLAAKLREKAWKKIYLIPTGPTTLALQIKLLVYHVTRLSTIDLFYSRGEYFEIGMDYRTYLGLSQGRD